MKNAILALLLVLLSSWIVTAATGNDPSITDVEAQALVEGTVKIDLVDADLPFGADEGVMSDIDDSHHHGRHRQRHKHNEENPTESCHKTCRGDYAMTITLFEKVRVEYQAATLKLAKSLAALPVINAANAAAIANAIADIDVSTQSNAAIQAESQQLRDALAICHTDDQSCQASLLESEANKSDANKRCLIDLAATQATLAATQSQAQKCYTSWATCTISDTQCSTALSNCLAKNATSCCTDADLADCQAKLATSIGNATALANALDNENANSAKFRTRIVDLEATLAACKDSTNSADLAKAKADAAAAACHEDLIASLDRERTCESNLAGCNTTKDTCVADLANKTTALTDCSTAKGTCIADLANKTTALTDCSTAKGTCVADLANRTTALTDSNTAKDICIADLAKKSTALTDCSTAKGACIADLAKESTALTDCSTTKGTCIADLANKTTALTDCGTAKDTCIADLANKTTALTDCNTAKGTHITDLANKSTALADCNTAKDICVADLASKSTALTDCNTAKGTCFVDLDNKTKENGHCQQSLKTAATNINTFQNDLTTCLSKPDCCPDLKTCQGKQVLEERAWRTGMISEYDGIECFDSAVDKIDFPTSEYL
ncbi:hypothetical protein BGZ92_004231 [Podila epicladia]|nr:hypothetical protein BGZ92_004231 [Podila epicladia]